MFLVLTYSSITSWTSSPAKVSTSSVREEVQSIHEPRKLTSGASWFAEWSPSQLLANQNRLRVSCIRLPGSLTHSYVQQIDFQKQIFGFYIHQKPFFRKKIKHDNKAFIAREQFVLKSQLLLRFRLLILFL